MTLWSHCLQSRLSLAFTLDLINLESKLFTQKQLNDFNSSDFLFFPFSIQHSESESLILPQIFNLKIN